MKRILIVKNSNCFKITKLKFVVFVMIDFYFSLIYCYILDSFINEITKNRFNKTLFDIDFIYTK